MALVAGLGEHRVLRAGQDAVQVLVHVPVQPARQAAGRVGHPRARACGAVRPGPTPATHLKVGKSRQTVPYTLGLPV